MPIAVKDLDGKVVFYIDGEVAKDANGKRVGESTREADARSLKLARRAAFDLSGGRPTEGPKRDEPYLMDLAPSDVSTAATQASFGIMDGERVADVVSPVRRVSHNQGVFYGESVLDATNLVVATGTLDGAPPVVNPFFKPTTFTTVGYALAAKIPRGTVANADFDLKARATHYLVEKLTLMREYRVAQLLITGANFAANNRQAAVAKWNGGTTANPLTDMFGALGLSYMPANVLIMPEVAAQYFYQNANSTAMRDYVQSGGEMPKVLFARAKYLAAGAPSYMWAPGWTAGSNANVPLVRAPKDIDALPTSVTFRWDAADSAVKDGYRFEGVLVREFTEPQGTGSDWIVVAHDDIEVMVSNQIGAIITGALA